MGKFFIDATHAMIAAAIAALMLLVASVALLFTFFCAPPLGRLRGR